MDTRCIHVQPQVLTAVWLHTCVTIYRASITVYFCHVLVQHRSSVVQLLVFTLLKTACGLRLRDCCYDTAVYTSIYTSTKFSSTAYSCTAVLVLHVVQLYYLKQPFLAAGPPHVTILYHCKKQIINQWILPGFSFGDCSATPA